MSGPCFVLCCIDFKPLTTISGSLVAAANLSPLIKAIPLVSALRLGGHGSIPDRVIPKTIKMVPDASPLGTQHQGLDWGYYRNRR